ncbi:MAG: Phosphoethanolamine transferase EptB [Spirochaetes bacterium ADurb.Bin218]|jgi:glucan phosphoethanolaminetransferase (alkaline phosphatase superfamily)|nr:MAG: Phosphoethanolamine transferase EptB [Spirochaetes bacterium ADurb.Bin218]HOV08858.1 sulfatase-like hydrolase/transferase [Spirochaetota bacterium]
MRKSFEKFIDLLKIFAVIAIMYFSTGSTVRVATEYFFESKFQFFYFLLIWAVSIFAIIAFAFKKNSPSKIIVVTLLGISGFALDLHYTIMGDCLTVESMSFLWSEKSYASEALTMYWQLGLWPLIRLIIFLVVSFIPSGSDFKIFSGWRRTISFLLSILFVFEVSASIDGKGIDGLPVHVSLIPFFAAMTKVTLEYKITPRKEVSIPVTSHSKIDNIILIVDESIRGDFIDLNYNRKTTPYLLTIKEEIINYGLAMSSYNRSNGSNAILRMGIGPEEFTGPDGRNLFTNPLIWQYARKAGYRAIYLDAQKSSYNDYMDDAEAAHIDTLLWIKSRDGKESSDHAAAWKLRELINSPGKKFIYLVKSGAHFHYENTYPDRERIFKPVMEKGFPTKDRQKLVNSYRNSIRWTVNEFFKILLKDLSLENTIIIYTSDHGQNLFDDSFRDTMLLHGRSKNSIPQEAIVPMMIFTHDKDLKKVFADMVAVNYNKCSHYQIFPTILYLMGYDKEIVTQRYYKTLLDKMTEPVGYCEGNVRYGKHILKKVDPDFTKYIDPELMEYTK